jgi:hypothetical protein
MAESPRSLQPSQKAPLITELEMLLSKVSDFKKQPLPVKIDFPEY